MKKKKRLKNVSPCVADLLHKSPKIYKRKGIYRKRMPRIDIKLDETLWRPILKELSDCCPSSSHSDLIQKLLLYCYLLTHKKRKNNKTDAEVICEARGCSFDECLIDFLKEFVKFKKSGSIKLK